MMLPLEQKEALTVQLQQMLENPIAEDQLSLWRDNPITKQFLAEFSLEYLDQLLTETVVVGALIQEGTHGDTLITRQITNPVSETAINTALAAGRIDALQNVITWVPDNLQVITDEDEEGGEGAAPYGIAE